MSVDPLARELAAIRRRAERRETVPSADALRLLKALDGVLRQAAEAEDSPHRLTFPSLSALADCGCRWGECKCPGAITAMWTLDPVKVREGIERELSRRPPEPGPLQDTAGAATAAGGGGNGNGA